MKTVVIQIGNPDDKLKQCEWSHLVLDLEKTVRVCCQQVHFTGFSAGDAPWQNHCVVADCDDLGWLQSHLEQLCQKHNQGSIAVTVGATIFVSGKDT